MFVNRNVFIVSMALIISLSSVQCFSPPSPQVPPKIVSKKTIMEGLGKLLSQGMLVGLLAVPQVASAVSGGGLDYANLDITGQDFSNGNYKGKDFTQVS